MASRVVILDSDLFLDEAELCQFAREMERLKLDHAWYGAARRGLVLAMEVRARRLEMVERCPARCVDFRCEGVAGHDVEHHAEIRGVTWTDEVPAAGKLEDSGKDRGTP